MRTCNPPSSDSVVKLTVKSVYHFAVDVANRRNRAMQKGRPITLSIWFACITTHVKKSSLSRTVPSRSAHAHRIAREGSLRCGTPDTTLATALSRVSRQHISSILQRLQDAHTGRWSIFSRHIQQLLTQHEINMTQAVPPTAQQTRHLTT